MFTYLLIAYVVLGVLTALVAGGYAMFIYVALGSKYGFLWSDFLIGCGIALVVGLVSGVTWPWVWYKKLRERLSR